MLYTPFNKDFDGLKEKELQELVEKKISEGWFIEFKRDIPKENGKINYEKLIKPVSAFANTKGGWIFWGVAAEKNIATEICGIENDINVNLEDRISQIISDNIHPKPIFYLKTIPLSSGRIVFVIKVEENPTPPYITSEGVIYQRENNESKPIKDRYILEKLSEKTENYHDSINRFSNIDYQETKGQSESTQSYLELYLFPLPFKSFAFKDFFKSDFFKRVALRFFQGVNVTFKIKGSSEITIPLYMNFNSIYSSENSLIIRPLNENNIAYKTTTAELFFNGNLKFLIPLSEFDTNSIPEYYKDSEVLKYLLDKYSPFETVKEHSSRYGMTTSEHTRRKQTDFVSHIRMIDGAEIIYLLLVIIMMYKNVLSDGEYDLENDIGYRVKVTNTWRKFIFFDNKDYLDKIKLYNLPIAPKDKIEVPTFIGGNHYTAKLKDDLSFFSIAKNILEAIGLPDSDSINFEDI